VPYLLFPSADDPVEMAKLRDTARGTWVAVTSVWMAGRIGGGEPERLALRTEAESEAGPKGDGAAGADRACATGRTASKQGRRDGRCGGREDGDIGVVGLGGRQQRGGAVQDRGHGLLRGLGSFCAWDRMQVRRLGLDGWRGGSVEGVRESERMGLTSRSKIAEDDECLSHPLASETSASQ
jgi:hypothetical protein